MFIDRRFGLNEERDHIGGGWSEARAWRLSPALNSLIQSRRAKVIFHKSKKNIKFSPRQLRFLELYFSGYTLKDSAKGAGYQGTSDQSLCNTGGALLRRAVATDARIAQLMLEAAENCQSESGRLKGLSILVKAMSSQR